MNYILLMFLTIMYDFSSLVAVQVFYLQQLPTCFAKAPSCGQDSGNINM